MWKKLHTLRGAFALALLILVTPPAAGQAGAQPLKKNSGSDFNAGRYSQAIRLLLEQAAKEPANGLVQYQIGVCYLKSRSQQHKAAVHFEKAIQLSPSLQTKGYPKDTEAPADVYRYYAQALQYHHEFDKAIGSLEKYREHLKGKSNCEGELFLAEEQLKCCLLGQEIKKNYSLPGNVQLSELFGHGQKELGDFSKSLSADKSTMIFTLRVPVNKLKKPEDKYFLPHEVQAKAAPTATNKPLAAGNKHEEKEKPAITDLLDTIVNITTVGTSVDGQVMLTYRNESGDASIYMSRLTANKWSAPEKLPKTANDSGWEMNEFVTADGGVMYFVSDREGGYGGKDIYRCRRLENGDWSKAENLGANVNSQYDEEAPFMQPDGTTLYFSSNRDKPTVSFDIFTSTESSAGKWTEPVMVGYPINSNEEQVFYQVSAEKRKTTEAITSGPQRGADPLPLPEKINAPKKTDKDSKRKKKKEDKKSSKAIGDHFMVTFTSPAKTALTMIKGEVTDKKGKNKVPAKIIVKDLASGSIQSVYETDQAGQYAFLLPENKISIMTFEAEGYLFRSEILAINSASNYFRNESPLKLEKAEKGAATSLYNLYYEKDNSKVLKASDADLKLVSELLLRHPRMVIEIEEIMYGAGDRKTARQRAEAVQAWLASKGIDKKRVKVAGSIKSAPGKDDIAIRKLQEQGLPLHELKLKIKRNKKAKHK